MRYALAAVLVGAVAGFHACNRQDKTVPPDTASTQAVRPAVDADPSSQPAGGSSLKFTAWTPPINGLVFRAGSDQESLDANDRLPVTFEIRNVGKAEVYVQDPARMDDETASAQFCPIAAADGSRFSVANYRATPPGPKQMTLLKPGQTIRAMKWIRIPLPKGTFQIDFQISDGWSDTWTDGNAWQPADVARIKPKAWRHGARSVDRPWGCIASVRVTQEHGEGRPQFRVPHG